MEILNFKKKYSKLFNSTGFTLVEVLVVTAIAGMLLSIIFTNLRETRVNSRNSKRIQDATSIQNALALYNTSNRKYPGSVGTNGTAAVLLVDLVNQQHIPVIPSDPLGIPWDQYYYCPGDNFGGPQAYILRSKLELEGGNNPVILTSDVDGTVFGCDCADASQYYCVTQ